MKMNYLLALLILLTAHAGFSQGYSEDQYPTTHYDQWAKMNQSKQETIEWFKDATYGMFIHWGLYSIPGGIWKGVKIHDLRSPHVAEWIMHAAKVPRDEYSQLASQFNPTKFNADEITKLAKDAGMKYLVITAKHHDGFALFDSKVSEYDIMDASPFKRDIIKELHDACKKQGLAFGVYYSHNIDWQDGSDAQSAQTVKLDPEVKEPQKSFGSNTWDPSPNSFEDYLQGKAYPQVKELMNQYPDMKLLWYDMPYRMTAEQSYQFYKIVHDLQPQVLINERIGNGYGDFTIPGDNTIPLRYEHLKKPWETVGTFNNSWGYNSYDNDWKSPEEVLYWLVEIASKGGNYMLNIGPTAEGVVPQQCVNSLKAIGKWLSVNGEAIYGTKRWSISREGLTELNFKSTDDRAKKGFKNYFTPQDFWFTQNESHIYAISLVKPQATTIIKAFNSSIGKIKSVVILGKGRVKFKQTKEGLFVSMPKDFSCENGFALKIDML
ncbi:MAG TPA: alpha-L-fucosidase [Prolixibacteraceae bacterium]|nr:alpha-L-fucosidase [Prolixibacteraceae bacterium]